MKKLCVLAGVTALVLAPSSAALAHEEEGIASPCNEPVLMVVTGTTHDRQRMFEYAMAIAKSEIYQKLGGYYVNVPRPIADFEGETDEGHTTLIVRFPCLANAKAFWNSRIYQETIIPMRQNPSAGDYIVRVYPEAPLRSDIAGKVGIAAYTHDYSDHGVEQVEEPGE